MAERGETHGRVPTVAVLVDELKNAGLGENANELGECEEGIGEK